MSEPIKDFEAMPEMNTEVFPFANDLYCGFTIRWAAKGIGFGELVYALNLATMEATVDDEHMGAEFCAEVLAHVSKTRVMGNPDREFVHISETVAIPHVTTVDK